jgi:tetratricopeptide (TPR) repeat protein
MTASYPDEPVVMEHMDSVYKMASDGTGSKQTTIVMRVQSEASVRQLGVLTITYAGNSQRVEIAYARVRKPDGTVVETPVKDAIDMPSSVTQAAPIYSDLKQLQLPIKSLRVGDTLEWQASVTWTKVEAPGNFWGQENFIEDGVALSQTLELHVPKDIYVNVWSPTNKPLETVSGQERVYRWEASHLKPSIGKEADAEKELKKKQVWTPEQELDAREGKLPAVAWTTFKSWEAVGAWYRGVEGDRMVPDPTVKAKIAEVTAGKGTEEEKVRAVYGYVATQIRYIGVEFGVGWYQPHRAAEVLENQYGDCKDKHTLLAAMLGGLGLHPNAVLIGAGVRFNEAVPSPAAFNHLITTVAVGGQQVWLDSTTEVAPYRMLMYGIRDKKSLVIPEAGVAMIEKTPAKLPFAPFQTMDAVGSIDKDGTSNSRIVLRYRGDNELGLRASLRQISPAQYDQVAQQLSQGMSYEGTISHAEIGKLEDTAEPLKISYDYKREKGGDWEHLQIVPQLAPVFLPRMEEKDPPIQALWLGVPRVETSTAAMKLPDGWGTELPEGVHERSAYATYDETYKFEKGTLYAERRIEVLQEKVPVSDWKSYKKWVDDADLAHDQWVKLVTDGHKAGMGSEAPPKPNSVEAAQLVSSAYQAISQHNLNAAKPMLDKAKNLNSDQVYLWSAYGYYDYQQGNMSAAIQDYRMELSVYPREPWANKDMAEAQTNLGLNAEAKETLRNWVKVDESDPVPPTALAAMLLQEGDASGAVTEAEAAIAKLPEDRKKYERLQLTLGQAQMKAGLMEAGRVTLLAVLKTTQSPGMMNDTAYDLADAGQELDAAESATRTALGKMTEESKTWTLDENPQSLIGKSRLIAATWDTMGWIFYREGKLDEAKSYINAAWLNQPSIAVGEHLGEIEMAKGNKSAALHSYELAMATVSPYDAMGVKKAPGVQEKGLIIKTEALRKTGIKSTTQDGHVALQNLRKIPLEPAGRLDGTAEYLLLVSKGVIVRSKKIGPKELQGGNEMLKKANLSQLWPVGEDASLVRAGMLNCHTGVCELVLEP